jgi:hypothetical protein
MKNAVFWDVTPKRRFTQELHGAASQKTAFFQVTVSVRMPTILTRDFVNFLNPSTQVLGIQPTLK